MAAETVRSSQTPLQQLANIFDFLPRHDFDRFPGSRRISLETGYLNISRRPDTAERYPELCYSVSSQRNDDPKNPTDIFGFTLYPEGHIIINPPRFTLAVAGVVVRESASLDARAVTLNKEEEAKVSAALVDWTQKVIKGKKYIDPPISFTPVH